MTQLADTIARRVCRHLVRKGWLEGEDASAFLSERADGDEGLDVLRMSSITCRIAIGKHAGRKVATLQTIPADNGSPEGDAGSATAPCVVLGRCPRRGSTSSIHGVVPPTSLSAKVGGFSLHVGVAA